MWGHGSPHQFTSLYSAHKHIFLRPVDLDMHICRVDTELVAETPFHSLSAALGRGFIDLGHCPRTV